MRHVHACEGSSPENRQLVASHSGRSVMRPGRAAAAVSVGATFVVLARHGQTDLNASGLLRGHLDPALDAVGQAEADALGRAVAQLIGERRVTAIASSPLRRAVQTATAIGGSLPAAPAIQIAEGLIDRDYGRWAGHSRAEVERQFGTLDGADGVESPDDVAARAIHVLNAQVPLLTSGPVVLVAHDAVNRLLLASLDPSLGPADTIGQDTACWNLLSHHHDSWHVELINQKPRTKRSE